MQLMQGQRAAPINAEQMCYAPDLIKQAFDHPTDPRTALRDAGMEITNRIAGHARTVEPDRRVRQIIKWANENLDGPLAINEAARDVGLSPSRASHLFVEETGLPVRTYVLWLRVVRAVDAHTQGPKPHRCGARSGLCRFRALEPHVQAHVRVARRLARNVVAVSFKPLALRGLRYAPVQSDTRIPNQWRTKMTKPRKTKMTAAGCGCSATCRCGDKCPLQDGKPCGSWTAPARSKLDGPGPSAPGRLTLAALTSRFVQARPPGPADVSGVSGGILQWNIWLASPWLWPWVCL